MTLGLPLLAAGLRYCFRCFRIWKRHTVFISASLISSIKSPNLVLQGYLARWYNDVEKFGYEGFNKVIETFENHNDTIVNYFEDRLTNASAESFKAKIKAFRTQFRGVGDIKFFMYRLATLYS